MTYYYNGEIKWNESGEELTLEVPGFEIQISLRNQMLDTGLDDWSLDVFLAYAAEIYSRKLAKLKRDTGNIPIPLTDGETLYDEFLENNIFNIFCPIKKILTIQESIPLILELDMELGQKDLRKVEEAEKKIEDTKPEDRKLSYQFKGVVEEDELKEEGCYEKYKDVWKERLDKKYANESENRRELLWELLELELRERNKK